MRHLILIRHGKSEWNHLGLWTGWTDVELVEEGRQEARRAGEALRDISIHRAYVSELKRARQTLDEIIGALEAHSVPVESSPALNERHYGAYTGKNKWQVQQEVGEEQFQAIRRGWDTPIPEGETLKDVYHRVRPYYEEKIAADLRAGRNVIIVAHGNTLRALVKHIEGVDEAAIADVEIGTGEIHLYRIADDGAIVEKEVRAVNEKKGAV